MKPFEEFINDIKLKLENKLSHHVSDIRCKHPDVPSGVSENTDKARKLYKQTISAKLQMIVSYYMF